MHHVIYWSQVFSKRVGIHNSCTVRLTRVLHHWCSSVTTNSRTRLNPDRTIQPTVTGPDSDGDADECDVWAAACGSCCGCRALPLASSELAPSPARIITIYSASAAIAVDSSHTTASSPASWSRFSPPSNSVNGHVWTMWFMVCRWPQSQKGDWAKPHLCKLARHGP